MDRKAAIPVGGGYFVSPLSADSDRWWQLRNGETNEDYDSSFFFDASSFPEGEDRSAAAVAAAREHLRLQAPANRRELEASVEYHRQRIERAQDVMAQAKDLNDMERYRKAEEAAKYSTKMLMELGAMDE